MFGFYFTTWINLFYKSFMAYDEEYYVLQSEK